MSDVILAIDQGTTSSRALVFDRSLRLAGAGQQEFQQHFPQSGWVEHEPEDLWTSTLATCREALARAGSEARQVAGIGLTNQRETTLVWEKATGRPLHRAIVWQDRRTAGYCRRLAESGVEPVLTAKTGLILDPYFSASKIAWILGRRRAPGSGRPGARSSSARSTAT